MGSARITVDVFSEGWGDAAALLEKLPIAVRGKELESSIRKGLGLVRTRARQLTPKPGYPGDKPGLKALRDTISVVLRRYRGGALIAGVVGPEYPAGAHGHLVEHGHRIAKGGTLNPLPASGRKTAPKGKTGRRGQGQHAGDVPPHPFMQPAFDDVKSKIEPLIIRSLQLAVAKHGG